MQGEEHFKLKVNVGTKHKSNQVDRNKCGLEIRRGLYDTVPNRQEPGIIGPGGPFQSYIQGFSLFKGLYFDISRVQVSKLPWGSSRNSSLLIAL